MTLRIRARAAADVTRHADEIADNRPSSALLFVRHAEETFRTLERFPRTGGAAPDPGLAARGVRFFPVGRFRNYLVAYLPLLDGAEILRVIDGRRDLGGILDEFL